PELLLRTPLRSEGREDRGFDAGNASKSQAGWGGFFLLKESQSGKRDLQRTRILPSQIGNYIAVAAMTSAVSRGTLISSGKTQIFQWIAALCALGDDVTAAKGMAKISPNRKGANQMTAVAFVTAMYVNRTIPITVCGQAPKKAAHQLRA